MPKIIKIFYDLETTGLDERKSSIHQLSGSVEVNGELVESFDIRMSPHPKAVIEKAALKKCNITELDLDLYHSQKDGYLEFIDILDRYIDRYDKKDKAFLVGYNNRSFDDKFLVKFFELNEDQFFFAWFWPNSIDVMVLATEKLIGVRPKMSSFKLERVAKTLGLEVNEGSLHDATYDIYLTRQIYQKIKTF